MSTYKTTVFVCDNPACRNERPKRDPGEPPEGFHGRPILNVHAGGGDSTDQWYACDLDCVGPAVEEVVARHFRRLAGYDE